MYKLLIVDDEYNIREGLVNGIPWHEIGVEVVGAAVDGEDAYEKVELFSPDIIITDVSMDNMNGLELADLLKQKHPFIKVVILSGYDDFEFVSRALELKVFTYIIKPVHSDELMDTIRKLILEIEEERKLKEKIHLMELEIDQNRSLLTERFLYDLINGNIGSLHELTVRAGFLEVRFEKSSYACSLIEIPDYREILRSSGIKTLQRQLFAVRSILYDELKEYELWSLMGGSGSFTLLIGSNEAGSDFGACLAKRLEKLVSDIQMLLMITVSVSIGGIYDSILQLSKSYREALLASEYNAMSPRASVISIDDVQTSSGTRYIYPVEEENLIVGLLNAPNEDSLDDGIGNLFDKMEYQGYSKSQVRIGIMGLLSVIARKAMEMGVDIYQLYTHDLINPYSAMERYSTKEQRKNWLKNILAGIKLEMRNTQISNVKSVIIKANLFMKENFANPLLSLADVASHIFLNASYFSRLYKNETGESFVEALTKLRLDRARELLKDPDVKISAIAESTGYQSTRYFISVFKKHTGLTPLEYRKSM